MVCLLHFDFSDQMEPSPELWTTNHPPSPYTINLRNILSSLLPWPKDSRYAQSRTFPNSPSSNHPDRTYQEFLLPIHQVLLFAVFQGNFSELGLKYLVISVSTFLTDVSACIVQYYFGVLIVRLIRLFEDNHLK